VDNLTHSMVALLLARTGLNRVVPGATALAVGAANLPDLDIVHGLRGMGCYLEYHRGFSHAPFWLPALALAPLPLWWAWARRKGEVTGRMWAAAYAVSLVGLASHPLLDWLNTYGIRLGLPFSGAWLHLDWVHVVDLWIWALLALFVVGPWLARLVDGEIGGKKKRLPGRGMAVAGLLAVCGFVGYRGYQHGEALRMIEGRLYRGEAPRRVAAVPTMSNPWAWTALVETSAAWHVGEVDVRREFDPEQGRVYPKIDVSTVRGVVAATEAGRVFLDFAQFPVWRVTPVSEPEGGQMVSVHDLRFGLPGEGGFRMEVVLDGQRRVVKQAVKLEGPERR